MKAIPISSPEKAIMNSKGIKPRKKEIKPLVIILYVKPPKMFNNMCPESTLAASLKPKDTLRAK